MKSHSSYMYAYMYCYSGFMAMNPDSQCIHTHIYKHICIHIYIHKYVTYIHTYIHTHIYKPTHNVYIHTYIKLVAQLKGMGTVKQNLERRILTKSSENRDFFPEKIWSCCRRESRLSKQLTEFERNSHWIKRKWQIDSQNTDEATHQPRLNRLSKKRLININIQGTCTTLMRRDTNSRCHELYPPRIFSNLPSRILSELRTTHNPGVCTTLMRRATKSRCHELCPPRIFNTIANQNKIRTPYNSRYLHDIDEEGDEELLPWMVFT